MITAPYRFVPLNQLVLPSPLQNPRHNEPIEGGLSGRIEIRWTARGPLLVRGHRNEQGIPFTMQPDADEEPVAAKAAIPGATLRGMIRAVYEAVTFSKLKPINANFRFGFRDVMDDEYGAQLAKARLKDGSFIGGWLERTGPTDDTTWQFRPRKIYPSRILAMLTTLGTVKENMLDSMDNDAQRSMAMVSSWRAQTLFEKYRRFDRKLGKPIVTQVAHEGRQIEILRWPDKRFAAKSTTNGWIARIVASGEEKCSGEHWAVPVLSGKPPKDKMDQNGNLRRETKIFEYLLIDEPLDSQDEPIEVHADVMQAFLCSNGKPNSKGGYDPTGGWADLAPSLDPSIEPSGPHRIPVFCFGDVSRATTVDGAFSSIGVTRLFKIAMPSSVGDLVPDAHRPGTVLDMTESLFGFVERDDGTDETTALASRVAFSHGTLIDPEIAEIDRTSSKAVLMTPKPSFGPFYLEGTTRTYRASLQDGTMLAGRKRYPARSHPSPEAMKSDAERADNKEVTSELRFLRGREGKDLVFKSRIRFKNLHPAELGALLVALTWNDDTERWHRIGAAKPYGYGHIRANVNKLIVNSKQVAETHPYFEEFQNYALQGIGTVIAQSETEIPDSWLRRLDSIRKDLSRLADPETGDRLAREGKISHRIQGLLSYPASDDPSENPAKQYQRIKQETATEPRRRILDF